PGPGTHNFSTTDGVSIFVSKLDRNGQFAWAGVIGGTYIEDPAGLGIDNSGNLYLTGDFSATVDFDPGPGVLSLTSAGYANAFVPKLVQSTLLSSASTAAIVNDVAPTVNVGPGATIQPGGTFAGSGSFTDPGSLDTFTATVNYGDGSGAVPLTLNANRTF